MPAKIAAEAFFPAPHLRSRAVALAQRATSRSDQRFIIS